MAAADEEANPASSRSRRDNGALVDGARLLTEFRNALADPRTLPTFITRGVEYVPEEVWRKALLWACASGRLDFVDKFMTSSSSRSLVYTARDPDQYTALHRAVVGRNLNIVRRLAGISYECFRLLHARTENGWTALHLAVCGNDIEMVKLLIELYDEECINLPPDRIWDFRDDMWMTPLQYGVLGGFRDVVCNLLDSIAFRKHLNAVDYFRRSALHMACAYGDHVLVEKLLANEFVDPNSIDGCGYTPLHWAVHKGKTEVVRSFTAKATKRTIRTSEEDREGRPALQIAIENREIDQKVGKDIEKLLLTVPEVKDEVERLYRDRQVFVDAANAILVGAALIASVTFGGWLQPPNGSHSNLRIFWVFNSLSFFLSMATVLAGAATVLPMSDVYIGNSVKSIRRWLAFTSFLLLISVMFVLGAFATAGFTSLSAIPHSYQNMTSTTSVGTVICSIIGFLFMNRLRKIRVLGDFMVLFDGIVLHKESKRRRIRGLDEIRADMDDALAILAGTDGSIKVAAESYGRGNYRWPNLSFFGKAYGGQGGNDENRMTGFEEAFQEIKKGLDEDEATLNMVTLTQVCMSGKGLQFWNEFPSKKCRERAFKKDTNSWNKIKVGVGDKKKNLKDEDELFFSRANSFDEWNI